MLSFGMSRKNNYSYLAFLNADGVVDISDDEFLSSFRQDMDTFLMDYSDPRTYFTGKITAEVLGATRLDGAIRAFEMYHDYISYPPSYEANLRAAAAQGQNPDDYQVEVTVT